MTSLTKERLYKSIFAALAVTFTLFFFGPVNLYMINNMEFNFGIKSVFCTFGLISLIPFSFILLLLFCFKGKAHEKSVSIITIIGVLLWIQGNILVWNYGKFDGSEINWNIYIGKGIFDSLVWILLLVFSIVKSSVIYKNIKKICISILLVQIISLLIMAYQTPLKEYNELLTISSEAKYNFSSNKNVVIIVLDSFQTDVFQEIIDEEKDYADTFKGFTYFRNALGGYPYTDLSIPLILTGQYYDNSIPFEEWKKEAYTFNSIPMVLKQNGFDSHIFPFMDKTIYYGKEVASNIFDSSELTTRSNRTGIKQLYSITIFRYIPNFVKQLVYTQTDWYKQQVLSGDTSKSNHVIEFMNSMESKANAKSKKPVFKFYHLMAPHWPLTLNENLDIVDMEINRDNYKSYAKATLKVLDKFLNKLDELRIYDNSLIFVVGDHGASMQGQKFILQKGMGGNYIDIITDRVKTTGLPLMLAKPFNSLGRLKISDAPVSLSDIPSTVYDELNIKYQGNSIFNIHDNDDRARRFLAYSIIEPPYYGTMEEYNVRGLSWLKSSWMKTRRKFTSKGVIENIPKVYNYGEKILFGLGGNAEQYQIDGWSGPEAGFTWTDGLSASMLIPVKDEKSNLQLRIKASPYLSHIVDMQEVNLYTNGKRVESLYIQSSGEYTFIIPKEYIKDKKIQLFFELPSAFSPLSVGKSSDERLLGLAFSEIFINKLEDYEYGSNIRFGIEGNAGQYQEYGWSAKEDGFTWIDGKIASIAIPVTRIGSALTLKAKILPFIANDINSQRANIFLEGEKIGEWRVDKSGEYSIKIPAEKIKSSILDIEFELPDAVSPKSKGISNDGRVLGLAFREITISEMGNE